MIFSIFFLLFAAFCSTEQSDLDEFVEGNRIFTESLFKELLSVKSGNFMTSPLSVQLILSLVEEGAKGSSSSQLIDGLSLPPTRENRRNAISTILDFLQADNDVYQLFTANKIYANPNYSVKEDFQNIASSYYNSKYENIDFSDPEAAANIINKWVESQTNDRIKDLIEPDMLPQSTLMVLINTLFFKAEWQEPFLDTLTTLQPFYTDAENSKNIETMTASFFTGYYEDPDSKFLKLQYRTNNDLDLSMTIILPNERNGIQNLENNLNYVFRNDIAFEEYDVNIFLPKFKVETDIDLKPILQNLGITDIFNVNADLSGISGVQGDFLVSEAVQKTFIEVDERGTEAAAATGVVMVPVNAPIGPKAEFKADHPFLYYISLNDVILFAGKIANP